MYTVHLKCTHFGSLFVCLQITVNIIIYRDEEQLELLKQEKQSLHRKIAELQNKNDVCYFL